MGGIAGAAIVTTARASGTPRPPQAPRRRRGCGRSGLRARGRVRRNWSAAATRSATLDENVVLANSPSLAPSPVKSKRSTRDAERRQALGDAAGGLHVLAAGEAVREQRVGRGSPAGLSSRPASRWPCALAKSNCSAGRDPPSLRVSGQDQDRFQPQPKILFAPLSERGGA